MVIINIVYSELIRYIYRKNHHFNRVIAQCCNQRKNRFLHATDIINLPIEVGKSYKKDLSTVFIQLPITEEATINRHQHSEFFMASSSLSSARVSKIAEQIFNARKNQEPIPVVTDLHPELEKESAYQIQKAFIKLCLKEDRIAGYKIGISSLEHQRTSGLNEPAAGVLLRSGKKFESPVIELRDYRSLFIETEIALVIGAKISKPLKNTRELQKNCKAVMPAVELPNFDFIDGVATFGVDMVAANVIAKQYIIGDEKDHRKIDINQVTALLKHNGNEVSRGKGVDTLGNQWEAGLWTVNTMLEQGQLIEPGHIILTGLLGVMTFGQPGKYEADYGDFGKIEFEVK